MLFFQIVLKLVNHIILNNKGIPWILWDQKPFQCEGPWGGDRKPKQHYSLPQKQDSGYNAVSAVPSLPNEDKCPLLLSRNQAKKRHQSAAVREASRGQ